MMRTTKNAVLWILGALALLLLTACARGSIIYVDESNSYASQDLGAMAAKIDRPSFSGDPVADSEQLRHLQLVALRKDDATRPLADLLSEAFPAETRSVPYYAERANVDGRDAWVVVEVWGSADGELDRSRVWAFDAASSEVIVSTVF